jgi:hypothetical protein
VALDTALVSKSLEVKLSGVSLVQELSMRLPIDALESNLAYFVVGLLPIVEVEAHPFVCGGDIERDFQRNTIRALNEYVSVLSAQTHLPPIDCHDNPTVSFLYVYETFANFVDCNFFVFICIRFLD